MLNHNSEDGSHDWDPRADDLVEGQADQHETGIVGHNVGHLQTVTVLCMVCLVIASARCIFLVMAATSGHHAYCV